MGYINMPVDTKPLIMINLGTQGRINFKFNLFALRKIGIKDGYHVKVGFVKNRIYFDKCSSSEKELAFKAVSTGPNGLIVMTKNGHPEVYDLIKNGQNYGFFYMIYDSAREMWYIDLNKRCYENLRKKNMRY